jgi:iron complex transport system ATP-binding protein
VRPVRLTDPAVVGRDVTVTYGATTALAHSDFSIPRGTVTAVIGPNGSGKSTLLGAVTGLVPLAGGTIETPACLDVPRRISYVLQTTKVNDALPVTVREVVTMGRYAVTGSRGRLRKQDRDAVDDAMARTGIVELAGRHLHQLSGGQRQRVFVAQGLAQEHDLLLLDEPLTGIDLITARAIDRVLHDEIERGCTVVLTTHDLSEARVADYVLLLSGEVVAEGPPSQVLTALNLGAAYGHALLHVEDDAVFVDDPAHTPVPGRHVHRERGGRDQPSR